MGLCSFGDCNGDIGFLFFVYGKISLTMDTQSVDINMEINGCFIRMFFIVIFTLYWLAGGYRTSSPMLSSRTYSWNGEFPHKKSQIQAIRKFWCSKPTNSMFVKGEALFAHAKFVMGAAVRTVQLASTPSGECIYIYVYICSSFQFFMKVSQGSEWWLTGGYRGIFLSVGLKMGWIIVHITFEAIQTGLVLEPPFSSTLRCPFGSRANRSFAV